jgi:radical SAM superfamily enzyme YgiQ (UPF0313 family)
MDGNDLMSSKRVLIFCNYYDGFLKNASGLRLANELRKDGFEVKQIHHFVSFTYDELKQIIEDFCKNKDSIVCISTSFLSQEENRNEVQTPTWGSTHDGVDVFSKILTICVISKLQFNAKVIIGGWIIEANKFKRAPVKKRWKLDELEKYVDYFVEGMGGSSIKKLIDGLPQNHIIGNLVSSDPIADYSDISTSPTKEDYISPKESLYFEMASGCIFSCHFCNFGSLGKKKHEYMRSYESLKNEIISNYENFGTILYNETDNIVNDYQEKLNMLIRIRDETGIDLRWAGYVRLDTIKTKQQADLLIQSGMVGALMGIESFTPSVGKHIGKMTDKNRLVEILHMCRESWKENAIISGMFIAGLPTETMSMLDETFEFLTSIEGRHLIDTFRFNKLHVNHDFDNKNDINKARNSPFKDYILKAGTSYGSDWTSPWCNSDDIDKLVNRYNETKFKKTDITTHNIAQIANLGYSPDQVVKMARNGTKYIDIDVYGKTKSLMKNYRTLVINDIKRP